MRNFVNIIWRSNIHMFRVFWMNMKRILWHQFTNSLKITIYVVDKLVTIFSRCKISESSAYKGVQNFKDSGISFIYNRNGNGPNIEPCGIPQSILLGDEICPLTIHRWNLLVRYSNILTIPVQYPIMPKCLSFLQQKFHNSLSQIIFERQETLNNLDFHHPKGVLRWKQWSSYNYQRNISSNIDHYAWSENAKT